MPLNRTQPLPKYTIFMDGKIHRGTAKQLITLIWEDASTRSKRISEAGVDGYAGVLVKDAPSYLAADFLRYLSKEKYPTIYDRALRYMAELDSSGVRILRQEAAVA